LQYWDVFGCELQMQLVAVGRAASVARTASVNLASAAARTNLAAILNAASD